MSNKLTRKHTAFPSFNELLNAPGGYIPSFDVSNPEVLKLANLYDEKSGRKCFRYGITATKPSKYGIRKPRFTVSYGTKDNEEYITGTRKEIFNKLKKTPSDQWYGNLTLTDENHDRYPLIESEFFTPTETLELLRV